MFNFQETQAYGYLQYHNSGPPGATSPTADYDFRYHINLPSRLEQMLRMVFKVFVNARLKINSDTFSKDSSCIFNLANNKLYNSHVDRRYHPKSESNFNLQGTVSKGNQILM